MREQDTNRSFFVVLTDDDAVTARLHPIRTAALTRLDHPSGRAWIVGRFTNDDLLDVRCGDVRVAVVGEFAVGRDAVHTAVSRYAARPDLARLRDDIGAGSFHVVVRDPDGVTVAGTATGSRRVHRTRSGGRTFLSSRADVLAALHDHRIDEEGVALRLLMNAPYPVDRRGVWRYVEPVPPGSAVTVRHHDPAHPVERVWWEPPPATRNLDDGAVELLTELRRAVGVRTGSSRALSADLSGGVDSTSLCFLAAGSGRRFTTYTVHDDERSDDHVLARAASADLPQVTSVWQHVRDLSDEYAHLTDGRPWAEEPAQVFLSHRRLHDTVAALGHPGPAVHLCGDGGDNLTRPGHSYCHDLIRTDPLRAVGHLRALRHTARWSLTDIATALRDDRPYGAWLADTARRLDHHDHDHGRPDFGWGVQPTLPPWAGGATRETAVRALEQAAGTCAPLSASRSRHVERHAIHLTTGIIRHMDQVTEAAGVRVAAPFTDDRVFAAALAVRPAQRFDPWTFKALLRRTMRGIVPDHVLDRRTKTVVPGDVRVGTARRHRAALLDLLHGSALHGLGLVDEGALRAQFEHQTVRGALALHLPATVSVEVWLRRLRSDDRPTTPFLRPTELPCDSKPA
ncbi:asparagine synthase-related protein [Micromonospora cathayae]|uniref:asparagine synthase (glutamine-hydrolyzing) n=1 Tax=Micromonospora cathayae TaxID=3028804 RepID=A0ABY7ZNI9_9ACTN|nr:asparagine synthase-related protein [Micromonospora sp. HUAS 3]WDZ84592.1 asparagine synthase-related protein [Micromonospora sp. HUAS 3]